MFRNLMSEFNLSGKPSGPRPVYRPAVEALEERTLLSGGNMTEPGSTFNEALAASAEFLLKHQSSLLNQLEKLNPGDKQAIGRILVQQVALRKKFNTLIALVPPELQQAARINSAITLIRGIENGLVKEATGLANGHTIEQQKVNGCIDGIDSVERELGLIH